MKAYLVKRLFVTLPLLFGISFISFLLVNLMPADPAEVALRVNQTPTITAEAVESMRLELGLDKPFWERYIVWLGDSLHGDFGISYSDRQPVKDKLADAMPATLYLAGAGLLLVLIISVTTGVLCAVYQDSIGDKLVRIIIFIGTALPNFWLGLLLIWFFAVKLDLVPTSGMESPRSVILPAITLAFIYISTYVRLIRNNMVSHMNENYVLYARMRGLKESTITRHVLKNSLQTSLAALGMSIPRMIAGTVIVENVFAWPGLGRLCVSAIFNRDFPVIQAYILQMALLFVLCNLLVDLLIAVIDPRIRRSA